MDTEMENRGLLRFLTCGSVDDGKSTLIGRLLHDSKAILADTLQAIESTSTRRGLEALDLSLLTDGLQAEREQGITIDVAYRYFSTGRRKYIIADAPGHEQYTRNMVTAASTAQLAILLVDARKCLQTQTRRHARLVSLLGIQHQVVAINKMDLVDHDRAVFERIRDDYLDFAERAGMTGVRFVPMSALRGDMVVERGTGLGWYDGPTLMDMLESVPVGATANAQALRFPVQWVCRPQEADNPDLHDYRGFMGRVESGRVAPGDAVCVLPSGLRTTVKAIHVGGEARAQAAAEQSVTLLLQDDVDVSRGDMIVSPDAMPQVLRQISADLCWLSDTPLDRARTYLIRHTTREVRARLMSIDHRLDVNTLERQPSDRLAMNDIARVCFKLAQPVFADTYDANRATGAFVVIDESTFNTVGAGMIVQDEAADD